MKRTRVALGIYRDAYGYAIIWQEGGKPKEKRFPLDAPLDRLKDWRKTKVSQAKDVAKDGGGSFVRDVVRFLRTRKGRQCFKSDRAHLRHWIHRFRRRSRWAIARTDVQAAVQDWSTQGYSPKEIKHRVAILRTFYRSLEPDQPTPCDGVKLPKRSKRKPRPVAADVVWDVALNLRKQEMIGRLRTHKTRARFLVLALTGARPAQVMRARKDHFDWDRGLWYVDPAKDDEGSVIAFNTQIRAAWELFVAANAWGWYDSRSFSKTVHRNGWPRGIRPYQLRHTVGQTLKEQGTDLGDIQDHMGHSTPDTTSQFYVGPSLERLRAISARLEGRVSPMAVELPRPTTKVGRERNAKESQNAPSSTDGLGARSSTVSGPKS